MSTLPRRTTVVALAALIVGGSVLDARADTPPMPSDSEIAASIVALDPGIVALDPGIVALDPSIVPMEASAQDSGQEVITLNSDILFAFNKATITPGADKKIRELVDKLPKNAPVSIGGHTDSVGTAARNATLSKQRADAVAKIVKAARPDLKLTVKGYGPSKPVAPNKKDNKDNPDGRAKNRRVEIRYSK